jgi:hypothetical protein
VVWYSPPSQAGPGAGFEKLIENLTIYVEKRDWMCLSAEIALKKCMYNLTK